MKIWRFADGVASEAYGMQCRPVDLKKLASIPDSGGMWCAIEPGARSLVHRHHDSEAFIVTRGSGRVIAGDTTEQVQAGDIVALGSFTDHYLENTGAEPLCFLDVWWQNWSDVHERAAQAGAGTPCVLVTATPPTPNGDLHVGHLSGPYLGADAFVREHRRSSGDALFVSGSDDHQSYVKRAAEHRGMEASDLAVEFADRMQSTLTRASIDLDTFSRPRRSAYHVDYVTQFFAKLYTEGKLKEIEREAPYCAKCKRYLFEAHLRGTCPHCGSASDGCACEACARPNDCVDLRDAHCRVCDAVPVKRKVKRLYFPLSEYAQQLSEFQARVEMSPHMRAMCRAMLAAGLPDIAVSHETDWGIPFPASGFEHQKIYVWAEMLPGFYAEVQETLDKRGSALTWRDVWTHKDWSLVQFFGFDNGYFHAVLFPALQLAYDASLHLPRAFVVNEFLRLDGEKFSTSRNHAIWGGDILERLPASYLRFYLASIRPESEQADFRLHECAAMLSREVLGELASWLRDYEARHLAELRDGVPEPGAWTADHQAFFARLAAQRAQIAGGLRAESFSLRTVSAELTSLVRLAAGFGRRHMHEAGVTALQAERRTSLALEVLALTTLAEGLVSIAPELAAALYPLDKVLSQSVLQTLPAGTQLRSLRLPDEERLRRWVNDNLNVSSSRQPTGDNELRGPSHA